MTAIDRPIYRHQDLRRLLHPASIAVIGASTRAGSFGERVLNNLQDYSGRIYAVNARYQFIGERPCYPSVTALPEVPDCAVICVPRDGVEEVAMECARAGVGGLVIFASGYAEVGKPERIAEQERLGAIAREFGMPIVGPNCIGTMNIPLQARITFMVVVPPPELRLGAVGLISQSGALGFSLAQAAVRGVSFSHVLTYGNGCDVDMADYAAFLAEEPSCSVIACVFEGMARPERLMQAARIAWNAGKPMIVYKMATGQEGAAAAMSHTGSLAGSHASYQAAFRRAGVVLVDTYEQLIETATFFAKAQEPSAEGVAVLATSGGAAIMCADHAEQHRVQLPQPDERIRAILEANIPEFGAARNPCDVTAQVMNNPDSLPACANAFLDSPAYAALIVPMIYVYELTRERIPVYADLAARSGKLICMVWATEYLGGPGLREAELAPGIANFRSFDTCFSALAAWQWRHRLRAKPTTPAPRLVSASAREAATRLLAEAPAHTLTEREAKAVLAEYGIPVVGEQLVQTADEAAAAAEALGFPVVLKAESPDLPHKTEAGVIRLNLRSTAEVRDAFAAIQTNAASVVPTPQLRGILVQPMVPQGVEMVIGARSDAMFGPLVVVGLGGIMVELMRDTALTPAPVDHQQALELLRQLKGFALLTGFRGQPTVDLDQLANVICRVSEFIADHRESVSELDINPLICTEGRMVAVDALIVRADRGATTRAAAE